MTRRFPISIGALRWPIFVMVAILLLSGRSRAAEAEVIATGLQFPEGTVFVGDTLYFVDYSTSSVLRLTGGKAETVWRQDGCAANGLLSVPRGLLVACYERGTVVLISLGGKLLRTIGQDDAGHSFDSPNDLAADAKGGVYFTGSGSDRVAGKVYYIGADQRVREVAANINYANGLAVSPDGKTLYLAESRAHRLLAFSIAADGTLTNSRVFANLGDVLAPGRVYTPDGVRIDKQGQVFVGLYDGGGLAVIDAGGKLVRQVDIPGPHHANLAISPDGAYVYGTTVYDAPEGYRGELYRIRNPAAR